MSETAVPLRQDAGFISLFQAQGKAFDPEALRALGEGMRVGARTATFSEIPSGYVYLGQFMAHDITRLKNIDDAPDDSLLPHASLQQLRDPSLDLDSLYGAGYDDPGIPRRGHGELCIGAARKADGSLLPDSDLPRDPFSGAPLVGDDRNDENLLVAQLHLQFLRLHNLFARRLAARGLDARQCYEGARRQVILHYQQVLCYDWLATFLDEDVWRQVFVLDAESPWPALAQGPARVPLEFSIAAMRFGHATILPRYSLNWERSASLHEVLEHTGPFLPPGGLPASCVVDWRFFFDCRGFPGQDAFPYRLVNKALAIDDDVSLQVADLEQRHGKPWGSLARRNLARARQVGLPSGQAAARELLERAGQGLCRAIGFDAAYVQRTEDGLRAEVRNQLLQEALLDHGLAKETPLWFYLLVESRVHRGGRRLGKLSSLIIAETLRALLRQSRVSLYRHSAELESFIRPTGSFRDADGRPCQAYRMVDLLYEVNRESWNDR